MLEEKIYLTSDGYMQYCDEIEKINAKILENNTLKAEACSEAPGDGWHDNFAYEDACRTENMLLKQVEQLLKQKDRIEIVDSNNDEQDLVNIGDFIRIEFIYDDGNVDIEEVKLTGNWKATLTDSLQEISLNSPLGRAIYRKKIGSMLSYLVDEREIRIHILEKRCV